MARTIQNSAVAQSSGTQSELLKTDKQDPSTGFIYRLEQNTISSKQCKNGVVYVSWKAYVHRCMIASILLVWK